MIGGERLREIGLVKWRVTRDGGPGSGESRWAEGGGG